MAFIVDCYNRYDAWDREHAVYKFEINENWYAVKKVEMEWGVPHIGYRVDMEGRPELYHVYEKLKDAMEYVRQMKALN